MIKKGWLLLIVLAISFSSYAAENGKLYSKTFGDSNNPAVIFLHGGPGYNSASFEITTAQKLADEGFYVITYDQRGCARSDNFPDAKYTLTENLGDIDSLYSDYHLHRAILLGHSWGGTLATFYALQHPEKVEKLILISTPVSYTQALKDILDRCTKIYTRLNDTTNLRYMGMIKGLDASSLQYCSLLFMHAFACGLYTAHDPDSQSKKLLLSVKNNPDYAVMRKNSFKPVQGIYDNIHYTTLNMADTLGQVVAKGVPVYGIYGADDGLFDATQEETLKKIIGKKHFVMIRHASHNVFTDRQNEFIETIKKFAQ